MNRRKRLKTKELRDLVAPLPMEELLDELIYSGNLEWYQIGVHITTLKLTKLADFATIIKEQTAPRANPRPYVENKTNMTWKGRLKN